MSMLFQQSPRQHAYSMMISYKAPEQPQHVVGGHITRLWQARRATQQVLSSSHLAAAAP
jgi:hypothetical protein